MELDCVFLVADVTMQQTFQGFLDRENFYLKLGTQPFSHFIFREPQTNDPGVYKKGPELLQRFYGKSRHAVVVLDNEWAGSPGPDAIQKNMKEKLVQNGWQERDIEIIVIEPELEIWLWQDAPYMAEIMRFNHQPHATLKHWLEANGHWHPTHSKPARPKEAFEAIQRITRLPVSGAIYSKIAQRISVRNCQDPAFCLLRSTLQRWFPQEGGHQ